MTEVTVDNIFVRVVRDEEGRKPPRLANPWQRVVLLREKDEGRLLPIWTGGPPEGDVLALHLWAASPTRPTTIDLTLRLLDAAGARVECVRVNRLEQKTFYAVITLATGGRSHEVDARPSDAVNLAVRAGAPIFVDEEVMARQAVGADQIDAWMKQRGEPGEWRSLSPELFQELFRLNAPPGK